ncbi:hypothetical protein [Sphingobacterium phlebotomi]|nr:hypothetical protein [Sphingobacterium phlebotomi]
MHRKFDDLFKIMEVDLSIVKGSVGEVAKELDIDPSDKLVLGYVSVRKEV